jgi:hypothetical protein
MDIDGLHAMIDHIRVKLDLSKPDNDNDSITFHFWEKQNQVSYRKNAYVKLENGKEYKACEIQVGDVIKTATGSWEKIIRIQKGNGGKTQ